MLLVTCMTYAHFEYPELISCSGGSVLADFMSRTSGPIKVGNIYAVVRSDDQVKALSKLGVKVVQFDLSDEQRALDIIVSNDSAITHRAYRNKGLTLF